MSDRTHTSDEGSFDMEARVDSDGRVWLSPSLSWNDAEVYEWLRDGQRLCEIAHTARKEYQSK